MNKFNNLEYLQKNFEQVLEIWYSQDTKENRISLFNVFNRLVIEVLKTDFGITGERCYEYAFHYSLDLLDEFLSSHTYQKGLTGHEVYASIKLSVGDYLKEQKHIIEEDIFSGFEAFTQNIPESEMLNYEIFSEINELLLLFFDENQIKRYLPLAVSIISSGNHSKIVNLNDQNFKYFCMLLISLGKKLGRYYQENVSTLNHSVNELTILIAGISENAIPQELVFGCDLASLDRLVEFAGGKTLTIPTREELKEAYEGIKESIRYPSIQAKVEPLEENFGISTSQSTTDQTFDLFCSWLSENKKGLSQVKLDKILKILSE
jgi:hypothetical protein